MIYGIPRGLVIFVVLALGVIGLVVFDPPRRACQSQVEVFRGLQAGKLFSKQVKGGVRSPRLGQELDTCKLGNSPGACFELFSTLRGLVRDLQSLPQECSEDLAELPQVIVALQEGMQLMVSVAWGEGRPEKSVSGVRQGWLESSDLALFCSMKAQVLRLRGAEGYDALKVGILRTLPGELPLLEGGKCLNCDHRKGALEILSVEEAWSLSLLAIRCDLFR